MRCAVRVSLFFCAFAFTAAPVIPASAAEDNPAPKFDQANNSNSAGHHVFMQARCFACHGEYGFGGVGPRFRENRFLGMSDYVVGQILIGRGVMPSFADALTDQQIAEVASYIRNSWGNQFGAVKPQEVAKVRNDIRLHPPQGRPHLPPPSQETNVGPTPPQKPLPPGQATPPDANR